MKHVMLPIAATMALIAGSASAQTAPAPAPATPPGAPAAGAPAAAATPTAGAAVYDTAGAQVGTVDSVTPQAVVINTGTNKVPVPPTSVGAGAKGLTMAMTKAQLDAAFQQAQAASSEQLKASLVAGADVRGRNGTTVIGKIKSVDAAGVTLTTPKGDVKLPSSGFAASPNGLIVGMTAEEFDAAVTAAAPAVATPTEPAAK